MWGRGWRTEEAFVHLGIERLKKMIMKVMSKFRKISLTDYMGFSWYGAYKNGEEVLVKGVHLQIHAMSKAHAMGIYNQFPR